MFQENSFRFKGNNDRHAAGLKDDLAKHVQLTFSVAVGMCLVSAHLHVITP